MKLLLDKETSVSRRLAFVSMGSRDHAVAATHAFDGKVILIHMPFVIPSVGERVEHDLDLCCFWG